MSYCALRITHIISRCLILDTRFDFTPHFLFSFFSSNKQQATSNEQRIIWCERGDFFSPAQAKKQSSGLFFVTPRTPLLLRSRPVSLTFGSFSFPPLGALNSASNPLFASKESLYLACQIRTTKYDIRIYGARGGI